LLNNKYTASGLSFSSLKGRDAVVAKVLLEATKVSCCAFQLGIVHIEESGWAEYTGYERSRGRGWYYDDDMSPPLSSGPNPALMKSAFPPARRQGSHC
jgi:hypothetical protein